MKETRIERAKKNIYSGILNKIVVLILPFVIRTVIIETLGSEYLGLDSLFSSILHVLNMAELGFSSAATYSLYKPLAMDDDDRICAYLALYRKIFRWIGTIIIAVGLVILPNVNFFIKGTYPSDINIYFLFFLYLLNTAISYLLWGYKTVLLSAAQKQSVISNVDTFVGLIKNVTQITVIVFTRNYYLYVTVLLLFTIINNTIVAYATNKIYPYYICRGKIDDNSKKSLLRLVSGLVISKIGTTSRNTFDNIILSMSCGLTDVTIYTNYYYVYQAVSSIPMLFIDAIAAGVGDGMARDSREKNYSQFEKLTFYFGWLGTWCTITMACLYQDFMYLWVGKDLMVDNYTMSLFCIYFYVCQIGYVRSVYARSAGIWWQTKHYSILEAVVNLALNILLGFKFKMNGVLIATIISVFIFSFVLNGKKVLKECFDNNGAKYFKTHVWFGVMSLLLGGLTYSVCGMINGSGYLVLIKKFLICVFPLNILITLISILKFEYRQYIKDLINMVRREG